jgi:hypothetical protein
MSQRKKQLNHQGPFNLCYFDPYLVTPKPRISPFPVTGGVEVRLLAGSYQKLQQRKCLALIPQPSCFATLNLNLVSVGNGHVGVEDLELAT